MKTIGIRELQKRLKEVVETSQKEGVVVTRNGKPATLLIGVEGSDWEDVAYQTSTRFWKLIEERRIQETVSLSEMKKRAFGKKRTVAGDVPSPAHPPAGCRFHTRCPRVFDRCRSEAPELYPVEGDGAARCFLNSSRV